jgi:Mrp family chromosome partitioning ATPase
MERLQKALDLARAERDRKLAAGAAAPPEPLAPTNTPANAQEAPVLSHTRVASTEPLVLRANGVMPAEPPAPTRTSVNTQDTLVRSFTRVAGVDPAVLRANGVMPADASGPAGHAFKMLRTQVLQRLRQRGWNTLAVVSATAKDGKTHTAINLAIAIAGDTNHTTLLVDFDLRNPSVHQRFGIQPETGVEQCLRDEVTVSEALINPQGYPKLLLLPACKPVSNSSDLLSSERTRRIIRELKERYPNRVVLFDLPPVLGADDALAFAPQVDAALLVVGEEHTRREDLLRCLEILRDIPIIGTVLNGSRTDSSLAYAY